MLIDTHAHLYFEQIKNQYEDVLKRAVESGVGVIINIGVDVERSRVALEQALKIASSGTVRQLANDVIANGVKQSLKIYSTIGIHPHDVEIYANNTQLLGQHIAQLEKIYLENPEKIVAVGECGLDYYQPVILNPPEADEGSRFFANAQNDRNTQKLVLKAQINLAKKLNLPLSIHCREAHSASSGPSAWTEVLDYLQDTTGVLHCYSGDPEVTKKVLETNYYISFSGNLTYNKSEHLRDSAKIIPLEKILIETDAPFLAPQSKRGQVNEPANIKEVAECIADIKGVSFEEIENQTTSNAMRLFNLKL
ncbi:MAG: Hydrolase, TatD family [Candidatus Daviesbacteria bacterium GW2011_GWA2_38_24]|uniref:Hydrolase, TatD family n=1 Tax=Candidatus Daviesbacteria bacterium GW2011_GWA2_38_24 TaxID=1618422 RepID=A0A0G0MPY8_9BACT|nr:MAG: Hydrolase, TatD family [Candidatus Daviesbacteria bacterium GW2011_GWA2_38_24]KKQ80772.1 MAG: Hydrolase, TatD family [Candidatus Daviesbacteria bacterium GW2011_GWA1_38_7]OGE22756.1 MAG: hypothetical protein A2688_01435 [Candidatus Daviesbacteria bacterium RIFCSPHIGHO2_01_FULL_38_8]